MYIYIYIYIYNKVKNESQFWHLISTVAVFKRTFSHLKTKVINKQFI